MKAIETRGYECSSCHKIYPDTEQGKKFAESCCCCVVQNCKKMPSYTGINMKCKFHKLKEDLPDTYNHVYRGIQNFLYACKEYEMLGGDLLEFKFKNEFYIKEIK